MGIGKTVKERAWKASQRAISQLLADERRAGQVAKVLGAAQRAKRAVGNSVEHVFRALSLTTESDLRDLGSRVTALRRRLRALEQKLSSLEPKE